MTSPFSTIVLVVEVVHNNNNNNNNKIDKRRAELAIVGCLNLAPLDRGSFQTLPFAVFMTP